MPNSKLQKLLRANRGRQLLPSMLEPLARAFSRDRGTFECVDLELSDSISKAFWEHVQQGRATLHMSRLPQMVQEIRDAIAQLGLQWPDREMILFRQASEFCGGVAVRSAELLTHSFELISLDGEDLAACDRTLSRGVLLQHYTDTTSIGRFPVFELDAWGT